MKSRSHQKYEQLDLLSFLDGDPTLYKPRRQKRYFANEVVPDGLAKQLVIVVLTDAMSGYKNDIVRDQYGHLYAIKSTITTKNYLTEAEINRRNVPVISASLTKQTLVNLVATKLSEFKRLLEAEFFDELTHNLAAPDIRFKVSNRQSERAM